MLQAKQRGRVLLFLNLNCEEVGDDALYSTFKSSSMTQSQQDTSEWSCIVALDA